jgi:hypothetical protein
VMFMVARHASGNSSLDVFLNELLAVQCATALCRPCSPAPHQISDQDSPPPQRSAVCRAWVWSQVRLRTRGRDGGPTGQLAKLP